MTRVTTITLLLVLLLALPLITSHTPAVAQDSGPWADGCDPLARALIDPTNTRYTFDLDAACTTYRACDPLGDGDYACQMEVAERLWNQCAPDAVHCQRTALLYAAGILVFDEPFGESVGYAPPDIVITGFPAMLTAFQSEDYASALVAITADTMVENSDPTFPDPRDPARYAMLPYARGVIQAQAGDAAAALAEFNTALGIDPVIPLVYDARADVYGSLGRSAEAAADALWLAEYVAARPHAGPGLIAPLTAQYTLDPSGIEDWLLYPALAQNAGPGGTFYTDQTSTVPRPVQLSFFTDKGFVIAVGVGSSYLYRTDTNGAPGQPNVLVLHARENGYQGGFSGTATDYNAGIRLEPHSDGTYYGVEHLSIFEGYSEWNFILAPSYAANPTANLDGIRCTGGVIARVRPGMRVRGAGFARADDYALYDQPGGAVISRFESWSDDVVIGGGGPICEDGVLWWSASYNGTAGWVPENVGMDYIVNPIAPDATRLFYCPEAPETRLASGLEAQVVIGLGANNVRDQASTDGAVVGALDEGSQFSITGGPVCMDGFAWWQVEQGTLTGWTAEGDVSAYWLAPLDY